VASAPIYDTEESDKPSPHLAVHDKAMQRFDAIAEATQEERALALQDRRFAFIAGAQWEDEWADQFENSIMVEINKTAAGLEKIINDYRENRVTVNFRAADGKASEDTADMLDGLFRADAYRSKAQQGFDNAFEEGVAGGYGAWRLCNEYEDEYDPENDHQRIRIEAIVDADQSVFWDPNAKLYDKSDAMYCYVIAAVAKEAFIEEWGADKLIDWPEGIVKPHYDWYTPDIVRVAEYYEVEIKSETVHIFQNVIVNEDQRFWHSELDDQTKAELAQQGWQEVRQRKAKRRRVHKWILSGSEVLKDCKYIAGDQIPVIPFYGQRRFIDNMERCQGHVRKAKDPQRVYNSQISKLTETASASPIERPIFTPQQIAGHEQSWAEANLNRSAYALINPLIDESTGQIVSAGPIGKVEPPQLQPVLAALIQVTSTDIAELTNSNDGADEVKSNISADAMDIAATRTDAKSIVYMDNMRQSMQRCGEVYLSMAREVYFEEGREVDTMGPNGEEGTATIAEPYTDERGRFSIRNDLTKGKYKVISDVTEATTTRRDKTVKTLVNVAQIAGAADPELAMASLNTAIMNMDGEGMDDLQDWIRRRLVSQGIVKPNEEEKQALAEAAANQQPDPQSQALQALAAKEGALAEKAVADTALSKAKTVETLVSAQETAAGIERDDALAVKDISSAALDAVQPKISPREYRNGSLQ
jgi:hypothetical protein